MTMTAEERLVEWAKSLHRDPWNFWPEQTILGRIKDEGAGAASGTAEASDGGLGGLLDRVTDRDAGKDPLAREIRCAETREAYNRMHPDLSLIVDATYLGWPSARDPRSWQAAVARSGLSQATYFRRKKAMLAWLTNYFCITATAKGESQAA